jgi:hypothetical protein
VKKNKGVTLLELIILVAIVCIIAAVVLPSMLQKRSQQQKVNAGPPITEPVSVESPKAFLDKRAKGKVYKTLFQFNQALTAYQVILDDGRHVSALAPRDTLKQGQAVECRMITMDIVDATGRAVRASVFDQSRLSGCE